MVAARGKGPSHERIVSFTAVGLVALALIVSNLGSGGANAALGAEGTNATAAIGNTNGAGSAPRIAVEGGVAGITGTPQDTIDGGSFDSTTANAGRVGGPGTGTSQSTGNTLDSGIAGTSIDGPFSPDGTLLKPVSVDTSVADGSQLLRSYRVRSGDTLTGIASKFHVSMMTIWWANQLKNKADLKIGQILTIPPVNGVVITVTTTDTLDSVAARYHSDPADIIAVNQLTDSVLVVGQTLTIPGARSSEIVAPKVPKPVTKPTSHPSSGGGGTPRPPASYGGGRLSWPVPGGYISQYFHYGHWAIDIAADQGTRVLAAAGGTVIFAGWKNNGGGYQVWIAHGSNLFTTYNHMMSISVGTGQHVGRGQQVGRVGMTGNASGPHLHFEVWIGPIWNGGTRVNPLAYL